MDVEIEGVGDGKVPVVNDQHVADVDLDLDEVCLQRLKDKPVYPCF